MTARSRLALACALALAALGITVSPASAAITHKFQAQITGTESLTPFSDPWGLALDSTGNLYVADATGQAIDIFNPLNVFQPPPLNNASVAPETPFTGPYVRSVAVDNLPGPNQGIVYVAESNGENVDVFKPKPGEPGKYELIQERKFHSYVYVAFDNSGGPNSGSLYVFQENMVDLVPLKADGTLPISGEAPEPQQLAAPPGGFSLSECCERGAGGLAVGPTGKLYLANPAAKAVDVYTAEATAPVVLTKGPPGAESFEPIGVGVDPSNGNVYAVDAANHVVDEFSPAGKYLGQITQAEPEKPFVTPLGVAVNASGEVYVSDGGAKAVDVYGPDEEEPLPPVVSGGAASGLTATEATLEAKVNPNGFAIQFETTYRFEYGTSTAYGTSVPVPDGAIGTGTSDVPVTTHLSGLSPNTTYHWRLVATNTNGTTTGPDHTFIYDESPKGVLPDNRAYEMVTPTQKNGALIGAVTGGVVPQISGDGTRVFVGVAQCFAGAQSCVPIRVRLSVPYEFSRGGSTGWAPTPLAPSATEFETNTWWLFNPDLGTGLFSMPTAPHGEDDIYKREPEGSFVRVGPVSPPAAGPNLVAVLGTVLRAASTDFSHVVFGSGPVWPFTVGGETGSLYEYARFGASEPLLVGVSGGLGTHDLISACQTLLGGGVTSEMSAANLSADGRVVVFEAGSCEVGTEANKINSVPVPEIYARVDGEEPNGGGRLGARTIAISQPQGLPEAQPDSACTETSCLANTSVENKLTAWREGSFQGASSDGSRAVFTSAQQLTDHATEGPKAECALSAGDCNLYQYQGLSAEDPASRRLLDLSEGEGGAPVAGGPRVQGVMAISEDGSHVYFVAQGVLTSALNSQGQGAVSGAENLYLYAEGHVGFIARLPEADSTNEWLGSNSRLANVSPPDGRFFVFTSSGRLTVDDARTDGGQQVFRYDATTGQLLRVSIGERGFNDNGNAGAGDASVVPGFTGYSRAGAPRTDPTMSDDGSRIFFSSPVALVAGALSSRAIGTGKHGETVYAQNIYQWHEGTVSLISDGRDTNTSPETKTCPQSAPVSATCLLGTDRTGSNVFFTTADRLLPQDTDTQLDIYDARICEPEHGNPCVQQTSTPPPPCLGEACHGIAAAPPAALAPPSATFNGAGNLVPGRPSAPAKPTAAQLRAKRLAAALGSCRRRYKHSKKRRASCEKSAHQKYGAAKKSSKKKGK
jgi:hypothetical protein